MVAPGFIDLQINGGYGHDLITAPASMWELGRLLPRHGVTSFLPTFITSPPETTDEAIEALARRPAGYVGAEPVGLHFEGPMLNPNRRGAHPAGHLAPAEPSTIAGWDRARGVALVTIAPELPGGSAVIAELVKRGVSVSAGHTEADADQARAAKAAGVSLVTHLFNAMAPAGHRQPNLVGVALADSDLTVGLIVDGVHVDPVMVAATWRAKGPGEVVLVTDAVAPMGLGPGRFDLGRSTIIADQRSVRNEAGVLAGSVLSLDQAVRNLVAFTGCKPAEAIATVTATPARAAALNGRGGLEPGSVGDVVLLDEHLQVRLTVCGGRIAYVHDHEQARISGHHQETVQD
jgi:N-acetylglucosamine-6-phosphate deacetylase